MSGSATGSRPPERAVDRGTRVGVSREPRAISFDGRLRVRSDEESNNWCKGSIGPAEAPARSRSNTGLTCRASACAGPRGVRRAFIKRVQGRREALRGAKVCSGIKGAQACQCLLDLAAQGSARVRLLLEDFVVSSTFQRASRVRFVAVLWWADDHVWLGTRSGQEGMALD